MDIFSEMQKNNLTEISLSAANSDFYCRGGMYTFRLFKDGKEIEEIDEDNWGAILDAIFVDLYNFFDMSAFELREKVYSLTYNSESPEGKVTCEGEEVSSYHNVMKSLLVSLADKIEESIEWRWDRPIQGAAAPC